jgi:hypothetical protein
MIKLLFTPNELRTFLFNTPDHQVASCYVMAALLNDLVKNDGLALEVSTRKGAFTTPVTGVVATQLSDSFNVRNVIHSLQFEYNVPEHEAKYCHIQPSSRQMLRLADAHNVARREPLSAEDVHNGRAIEGRCKLSDTSWDLVREVYAMYMDIFIQAVNHPFSKHTKVFYPQAIVFDKKDETFPTANLLRVVSQSAPFIHERELVDTIVERLDHGHGFKYVHSSDLLTQSEYNDSFSPLTAITGQSYHGEKNEWLYAVYESMPVDYRRGV